MLLSQHNAVHAERGDALAVVAHLVSVCAEDDRVLITVQPEAAAPQSLEHQTPQVLRLVGESLGNTAQQVWCDVEVLRQGRQEEVSALLTLRLALPKGSALQLLNPSPGLQRTIGELGVSALLPVTTVPNVALPLFESPELTLAISSRLAAEQPSAPALASTIPPDATLQPKECLRVSTRNGTTTIQPVARSLEDGGAFAEDLSRALRDAANRGPVVIDLTWVSRIGSQAVGAFIEAHRSCQAGGSFLQLCNVQPPVLEALQRYRIDTFLTIQP